MILYLRLGHLLEKLPEILILQRLEEELHHLKEMIFYTNH